MNVDERVGKRERMDSADIALELRKQITAARFSTNERLPPERALAERYGVARGTVREALRQLESAGFVARRAGSGTFITWSESEQTRSIVETTRPLELIEARFALEPHMVRLAVLHSTAHDLEKIEEHLTRMEETGHDGSAFADADELFHLELAGACQNPMILWMMQKVHEVRSHEQWARMRMLTLTPAMIETYNRQHRLIVAAIRARHAEEAAEAMKSHLAAARASLVAAAS